MIIIISVFWNIAYGQDFPAGNLVIAGGNLEDNNADVYSQLIELAGGGQNASFAVIPSASGVAVQSFVSFKSTLIAYGISPSNIHLIPVAVIDDDSTADVDESTWIANAESVQWADSVRNCSAIWFTGGDQMRTTKALFRQDGSRTPVLEAVWEVYNKGGLVGGSSAGAAIMSEVMIGGGNSLAALTHGVVSVYPGDDFPESEGVLLTRGLGFFPFGIVDQHFEQRGRIGRLVVALMHEGNRDKPGFGIDENTALIYYGGQKLLRVAGAGSVTIVNASGASGSKDLFPSPIQELAVSLLGSGDSYDLVKEETIPAENKRSMKGNEYYNNENPGQTGILSGSTTTFSDLMTINLMDNKGCDRVQNLNFSEEDGGFLVTLTKTSASRGFYTDKPDGGDHYTVIDVRMDITPVRVSIIAK